MNDIKRKAFRIILGTIWCIIGIVVAIKSEYINSIIFFVVGVIFIGSILKLGKKE